MKVKEIMTRGIDFIDRLETVKNAARKMANDNVGALPVFDSNYLVGIITDRDIVIRTIATGNNPSTTRVSEIMTSEVFWCNQNIEIEDAAAIMETKQVRRLLVKNESGHLIGMVSLTDLAKGFNKELAAEVLLKIATPAHPQW
jgi:CBS domain-containing protein